MVIRIFLTLLLLLNLYPVQSQSLEGLSENDKSRVKQLWRKIRCPVCNGQAIDESFVDVALSLKKKVVHQVRLGKTNQEILEGFRKEYGPEILFDPQMKASTYFLWGLPWVFLVCAGFGVFFLVRRRGV
jgi:cytochrome c-type biogenesis protein CcmH